MCKKVPETRAMGATNHRATFISSFTTVLLAGTASGGPLGADGSATATEGDLPGLESWATHQHSDLWFRATTEDDAENEKVASDSDLVQRMRGGFKLPVVDHSRTVAQRNWYVRHPGYLERVFNRSRPYLHHIVEEIERRGMPLEFALLPIVESAFDPFAYSHGRAAGLWQIIPGTGRRFGLDQNWWYDGRRDVIASTRAALDYLEFLAERYDGDYELAVAAYNSGEGTVDRAIRRNKAAGKPTSFWDLKLPRETSSYVPKLLALADIVANPERYEITLPKIADTEELAVVDTGVQIDLALAADLAGIDIETLYKLNPGFNQWATAPSGPHQLVVPIVAKPRFQQAIAELPDNQKMRWQRHKIRDGESLSEIAEQYGVTVATLKQTNQISGSMIRAGQHLLVPTASAPKGSYALSAAARLSRQQNRERRGNRIEHRVVSGESLWTIAQRYSVSTRALASWNGMAPRDTLSVGKTLVVWTDAPVASRPGGSAITRKVNYTVRSGDSLARIAARFRVRVADLARWNNLDVEKILRPGQKLTMFVDVTRQST
ncbi:MAG: LysM peptidoglycan-binding domain-containing protein [Pseudomonadota bacterium]